jgi:hypothetical protein
LPVVIAQSIKAFPLAPENIGLASGALTNSARIAKDANAIQIYRRISAQCIQPDQQVFHNGSSLRFALQLFGQKHFGTRESVETD